MVTNWAKAGRSMAVYMDTDRMQQQQSARWRGRMLKSLLQGPGCTSVSCLGEGYLISLRGLPDQPHACC